MSFRPARLRAAEWLIGLASSALLVILFVAPWYGFGGQYARRAAALGEPVSFTGWESLPVVRILVLIFGLGGLLSWYLQARCAAPALPVCAVIAETAFGVVVVVALIVRVLVDLPHANLVETDAGGYLGLALALAVVAGGYLSLRSDQAPPAGAVAVLETLQSARPSQ